MKGYENLIVENNLLKPSRKEAVKWMTKVQEDIAEPTIQKAYNYMGYEIKNEVEELIEGINDMVIKLS